MDVREHGGEPTVGAVPAGLEDQWVGHADHEADPPVGHHGREGTRTALELKVLRDPCPFDELRSQDLTHAPWVPFSHCVLRIVDLWPGELGCRNRAFQP